MPDEQKPGQLTGRASIQAGTYVDGELQMTPSQKAAAGPQPEVKTVQVDILRDGSFGGNYYYAGDTATVPEDQLANLTNSGFAARTDRVELAERARADAAADKEAADKKAATRGGRRSTAVPPMTTRDMPGAESQQPQQQQAGTNAEPPKE